MLNRRFCAPDALVMASLIEATKESQMSRDPRQAEAAITSAISSNGVSNFASFRRSISYWLVRSLVNGRT